MEGSWEDAGEGYEFTIDPHTATEYWTSEGWKSMAKLYDDWMHRDSKNLQFRRPAHIHFISNLTADIKALSDIERRLTPSDVGWMLHNIIHDLNALLDHLVKESAISHLTSTK